MAVVGVLVGAALVASPAAAFWSAVSTGTGSGSATTATVGRGVAPTATVSQASISVSWSAATASTGSAATGYTVVRYDSNGVAQTPLASCAGTVAATSCTETGVPDGSWSYTVTPRYQNWVGTEGPKSTAVRVDTTPPVNHLSIVNVTGGAILTGTTLWYQGTSAGSFNVSNAVTDSGSGPGGSNTGALPSQSQWQHTADSVYMPTGGPYVSSVFSWAAVPAGTASQSFGVGIEGGDVAGNRTPTTIDFRPDVTAPTGASISYANGTGYGKTVPITLGAPSDAESGVNPTASVLQSAAASLGPDNSTCGTYSAFATIATNPATTTSATVAPGSCYQFRYVVADRVGNSATATSASVVKVPGYASTVQATPGLLSFYRLSETGTATTIADSQTPANPGTYVGSPTLGTPGAHAGDPSTAVTFDGVDDYGHVTRQISDDFSIEFWFKSTQGLASGTNWFNGAGLVDADVSGTNNDFGTGLFSDGRVAVGTGTPDVSAISPNSYNDGVWHHVVMTRTRSTGSIVLFVDGAQVATATGGTQSLTSPTEIDFGRLANDKGNYYRGSLDDIALYTSALTPAQVLSHYQAGSP
ncbi:hypothetical protein GCM10025780_32700 [Frondihabitans cladoniiphilus]|uniref:Concanavalin A-like lectin/glucanase superfamily protein n=1 Tax=Frondihabitans cladoniiphilus TaxID=715785 RepID=A0ABP8W9G4_9MICO